MSVKEAIEQYLQALKTAADLFEKLDSHEDGEGGRTGAMAALAATVDFVDSLGNHQTLRQPLFRLFLALQSADEGATDPMLKPAKIGKKPPLLDHVRAQRGYLAGAMALAMADGLDRDKAARWVALQAGRLGAFQKIRSSPWRAVREWRDTAMAGNVSEDVDRVIYQTVVEGLENGMVMDGNGRATALEIIKRAAALGNPKR